MARRLPKYRIESDREGFFVAQVTGDDYPVDVTPTQRFSRKQDAEAVMAEFEQGDIGELLSEHGGGNDPY